MKPVLRFLKHWILRTYWFIFRPRTYGVKCLIYCDGEVLIIRNNYGRRRWTFPGGRIDEGETSEAAAKREVLEEVGIRVEDIKKIGEFFSISEYKRDTVYCFATEITDKEFKIDENEILEAKWFPLSGLPSLSPSAEKVLNMWHQKI